MGQLWNSIWYSLSDRWITSIVEDRDGKLWVGTRQGGLNHFDPQSGKFIRYQFDPQDPASLSDNHINALLVDKDGTLWVGTTKGLDRFDPETNSFTRYQHNADQPKSLSGTIVTAIYQDGRGHYWVGTADAGLNSFDAKSGEFASFQSNADDPRTLSNNHVTAIEEDANGTLWVGTTGGLNQLCPSANIFTIRKQSSSPGHRAGTESNRAAPSASAVHLFMAVHLLPGVHFDRKPPTEHPVVQLFRA